MGSQILIQNFNEGINEGKPLEMKEIKSEPMASMESLH